MAVQRTRGGVEVPQRNVIRNGLTEFQEGQSPSALTPISPVTVPGGSIRVDADTNYIHIVGGEGLAFKRLDDDVRIARVDGFYTHFSATEDQTSLLFGAEELFDPSGAPALGYGAEVVRDAFAQAIINKNPLNAASQVTDENLAQVRLRTRINPSKPYCTIYASSKNTGRTILLEADSVLFDDGGGQHSLGRMVAWSELSGGVIGGVTTTETDILSFSWVAQPSIQYRIRFVANQGISSTVADDLARVWYTDNSNNHIIHANVTTPTVNRAFEFFIEAYETGLSGTVNRKIRFVRGGGSGTLTFDAPSDAPSYISVEAVG